MKRQLLEKKTRQPHVRTLPGQYRRAQTMAYTNWTRVLELPSSFTSEA